MDDDTGWTQVLVQGWGPLVRAAVVERVERGMVGRRGVLLRALADDPSVGGHAACVEEVHERILAAVRIETGANLDGLGSQAAWACYDEVWGGLQDRWMGTSRFAVVPPPVEDEVIALVRSLSPTAAEHAGADVGAIPHVLPRSDGRVVLDVDGLFAHLACEDVTAADRLLIDRLLTLVRR